MNKFVPRAQFVDPKKVNEPTLGLSNLQNIDWGPLTKKGRSDLR